MYNSNLLKFPAGKLEKDVINKIRDEIDKFSKLNDINNPFARHKPHLNIPSIYEISTNKQIINNVNSFVGTECVLWYSVLFNKEKNTKNYIPWHYDDYFWNLKGRGCTVWIAVEDVKLNMGPMEFAIDYDIENLHHGINSDPNNILLRGNIANYEPKKNIEVVKVPLMKGEYSIHSNKVMHRSGVNDSSKDRMAFALRYISYEAIPESFAFIKRGAVSKKNLKNIFFLEEKPKKITKILRNKHHIISIATSLILTFFGDRKRNIFKKIFDLFKFIFSKKIFYILFKKKKNFVDINSG